MDETIFSQIRQEADDFYNGSISVVPGYTFNQYDTIKLAHLYLNSKYEDGSEYLGRDKLFFNVVVPPCEVATKMLNVDTKNIRLWPMNPKSHFSTYLLEKELKLWLKTSKLGRILNTIAEEAPRYGSVVMEKTTDGAQIIDLRRLIIDPTVETIGKSRFVTTIHYMTPSELRETGWDNVDEAIEKFGNTDAAESWEDKGGDMNRLVSTPYIKVYKRYGEVPEYWLKGGRSEKMVKALFIVAGADVQETNAEGKPTGEAGVILFKSKWHKDWPFKDFHYTKVKGRWLGVGIPEMLSDVQVRVNELKNQKRVSMELSSIHLFQTADKQIVRNVLTDLQTGDILYTPTGINPIVNEERNLPAFKDEEESYSQHADRLSFAYEAVRGEAPIASATATATINATQQATSVYAFKRENLALFLQEFFNELVMPQLMKDLTPEHIMRFTGSVQELQKLDEAAAEVYANDFIKSKLLGGEMVTEEDVENQKKGAIELYRRLGDSRFIKIKDAFYDDAEFEFDFIVGNEQADPQVMANNFQSLMMQIMQAYGPNDPRAKLFLSKYAETLGIQPAELEIANQQAAEIEQEQMAQQQMQQMQPQVPQPNGQPNKEVL
jgi:hypothetical protein